MAQPEIRRGGGNSECMGEPRQGPMQWARSRAEVAEGGGDDEGSLLDLHAGWLIDASLCMSRGVEWDA